MSTNDIITIVIGGVLGWIGVTIWYRFHPPRTRNPDR